MDYIKLMKDFIDNCDKSISNPDYQINDFGVCSRKPWQEMGYTGEFDDSQLGFYIPDAIYFYPLLVNESRIRPTYRLNLSNLKKYLLYLYFQNYPIPSSYKQIRKVYSPECMERDIQNKIKEYNRDKKAYDEAIDPYLYPVLKNIVMEYLL